MDDYAKLLDLAEKAAKPWRLVSYILAALLALSLAGNVYLATLDSEVVLTANSNVSSDVSQSANK
jgi:hypothetical protein